MLIKLLESISNYYRYVEEPPLTRPVAPIHAREAVANLRITSGSKLAS